MIITLSGGNYGGCVITWPEEAKQVSIVDNKTYWNYDLFIHTDNSLRADFIGCSDKPLQNKLTISV